MATRLRWTRLQSRLTGCVTPWGRTLSGLNLEEMGVALPCDGMLRAREHPARCDCGTPPNEPKSQLLRSIYRRGRSNDGPLMEESKRRAVSAVSVDGTLA